VSQAGIISTSSGPVPPTVATSYVTDVNSPAIPAANILNVLGNDTTANDNDGIRTDGSSGSNTLTIQLTNRLQGTVSTTGAASGDIITFTPTVVGTYSLEYRVAAYNETSLLGAGYSMFGAVRFDGVNSNICDTFDEIVNEEGTMSNVDITVVVSGANIILRSTGYALQEINWSAVGLYTFIGVV
jgi:hypothetical protein